MALTNPDERQRQPTILAFVSGKGGVGKTMVAAAFARELAASSPTLLIDLDAFNRGLTGLMRDGEYVVEVQRPAFLTSTASDSGSWIIERVGANLFHLVYPDLLADELAEFATMDLAKLTEGLREFVAMAAERSGCTCVVLDCHGGPDNTSFAACSIARTTILVSEPDRITFYGTFNFLRQMRLSAEARDVDIRLILNKVLPDFSATYLWTLYDRVIRRHFFGRELLAVYPLEIYLSKEFERTPFLTEVYPFSLLASKTRVALYDLLAETSPELLGPSVLKQPGCVRWYIRRTLGKINVLFDVHFVTGLLAMAAVLGIGLVYADDLYASRIEFGSDLVWWDLPYEQQRELLGPVGRFIADAAKMVKSDVGGAIFLTGSIWLGITFFLGWTRTAGRYFTYYSRSGRYSKALSRGLRASLLWILPAVSLVGLVQMATWEGEATIFGWGAALVTALFLAISVEQTYKTYAGFRFEKRKFEPMLRGLFVAVLLVVPMVIWLASLGR